MAIRFLDEQPQESSIKYIDERPGLVSRLARDLSERGGNISESFGATNFFGRPEAGQQSELEFLAQAAGQGIGAAGDVLGNLAISGYREFAPQSVQDTVSRGIESFGESGAGQALGGLVEKYGQWAEENPRAARNFGAVGNIASVMPWGKATTAAGNSLKESAGVLRSKVGGIVRNADKMDSATLNMAADSTYKMAEEAGAAIKPSAMSKYASEITSIPDAKTQIGKEAAQIAGKGTGLNQVQKAKDVINNMAGRNQQRTLDELLTGRGAQQGAPISLNAFNEVDQTLSEMLYAKGSKLLNEKGQLNRSGQHVKAMQEALRDKVLNASVDDIVGDGTAFKTLETARELWTAQLKMRDLEEMIGRSLNTKQPNYALKKNFGALLNKIESKGKTGFKWTKEEIEIIRKIANSGRIDELLSLFGSRLPSAISAGTGNFATGLALRGASELPRNLATNMQLGHTQRLLNTIAGVPTEGMGIGLARGVTSAAVNAPANAMSILGTGLQYRAPQLTALGLLQQEEQ